MAILVVIFIERYYVQPHHKLGHHSQDSQTNNAYPQTLTNCRVNRVIDGDSLLANCNAQVYSVRLESIDAPELSLYTLAGAATVPHGRGGAGD